MFLQKKTTPSIDAYSASIRRLKNELKQAEAIVIGAGAGISTADGFDYAGARFEDNFADFISEYHYDDMYSAGFYPYASPEAFWAYWSRYIFLNRYVQEPGAVYENLLKLVQDKAYFVLTTNVDHCFQRAGFDKERLFYTQGDYGLWQCSEPCHMRTYDNEDVVRRMVVEQRDLQIPSELLPCCPICGKPMTNNLRCDNSFVEDEGWKDALKRYESFVQKYSGKHVLFLELGVGENTPVIIKYPFWQMTYQNTKAVYACINTREAQAPREIQKQSICIADDIGNALSALNVIAD